MPDRKTTKRMFTHMINMMEQHDTMTISCGDPLIELLKDVRELLNEQEAVEPFHKCIGKEFSLIEDSYFEYCPYCGKPITWEGR